MLFRSAIAIEQKVVTRTPRSTVGSMTEIYDYLRVLFARIGKTVSPISGEIVKKQDVQDVVAYVQKAAKGDKIVLLVTFKQQAKRDIQEELNVLIQKGFSRIYLRHPKEGSSIERIEEILTMPKNGIQKKFKEADVFVLIDRLVVKDFEEEDIHRLIDSIGTAFYEGEGLLWVEKNETTLKS